MQDEVHGSVITYDGQKDFYTAKAGTDVAGPGNPSGRVRAMLSPRNGAPRRSTARSATLAPSNTDSRNAAAVNTLPPCPDRKPAGDQ